MDGDLLRVEDLRVSYPLPKGWFQEQQWVRAVDEVSFTLRPGETLGIVGETGCGKSSLARAVLQLIRPSEGRVLWLGQDLCGLSERELNPRRAELQLVFQDPLSSLNPRMTIGEIIAEPLRLHQPGISQAEVAAATEEIMHQVGLRSDMASRYPVEFSGGQCQRVSIARAMILRPQLLVCDEPVSALDVSIQAQVCNLLKDIQRQTNVAMLFISHDLAVVRYMSHRIMVMYLGRVMELAPRDDLFARPLHPYTQMLMGSVLEPGRSDLSSAAELRGEPPSPINPPSGCVFNTRCPFAIETCREQPPPVARPGERRRVSCHRYEEGLGT